MLKFFYIKQFLIKKLLFLYLKKVFLLTKTLQFKLLYKSDFIYRICSFIHCFLNSLSLYFLLFKFCYYTVNNIKNDNQLCQFTLFSQLYIFIIFFEK